MSLIYRVKSKSWDDAWEGTFYELLAQNESLDVAMTRRLRGLKPGETLDCVALGVSYSVTCREGGEEGFPTSVQSSPHLEGMSDGESMARAIESLLDALRQRGTWPSDVDVDLTGYESWRAAHPRQDS